MANLNLISVIIPTFNRADYIAEAVNSVFSQTYKSFELIIIDDGSTDHTRRLLQTIDGVFHYFWQDNRGIAAARNVGVDHATGNFLAFLDDDDIWLEDKLKIQMEIFNQSTETDVVYGQFQQFISPELNQEEKKRLRHLDGKVLPAPLPGSMLIRRDAFHQVGRFDESLNIGVEMDWYARLTEQKCKTTA